jgi:hypothetical protein
MLNDRSFFEASALRTLCLQNLSAKGIPDLPRPSSLIRRLCLIPSYRMRRIKMSVLGRNTERVSGRVLAWAEGDAKGMGKTNLAVRARETLTDWPSHASFSAI